MYAQLISSAVVGVQGIQVGIEVDLANGLPQFQVVGLPDSAVRESKDRVRAAIKNAGYKFPSQRITINLAPADIKKEGSAFDLPMAIGVLLASGQVTHHYHHVDLNHTIFIGELSLDGRINSIHGILPMAMSAKERGIKQLIVPKGNVREAGLVDDVEIYGFNHITEVIDLLQHQEVNHSLYSNVEEIDFRQEMFDLEDFNDVRGHYQVKRAIEVAVAGMHNLLLIGPPGSGKSMLAKRIPSILPELTWEEVLEVTKIYSVAGYLKEREQVIHSRPFRKPHHSISTAGLIGGGTSPKPGEISLAHRGILFLDELPEFPKSTLESLRQPLEDGHVSISRARANYTFPSEMMLVGAMNPCRCGYYGTEVPNHECQCTPLEVQRYRSKISGPMLDRVDIQIEVPWVDIKTLRNKQEEKSSQEMKEHIKRGRIAQEKRFKESSIQFNAEMNAKQVKTYCVLDNEAENVLQTTFDSFGYSGRALERILKIARTIADIDKADVISLPHIAEAMNYRVLDRK